MKEVIQDYDAQITSVGKNEEESLLAVGDVDGRVFVLETGSWD
jgi:hypothetical protein